MEEINTPEGQEPKNVMVKYDGELNEDLVSKNVYISGVSKGENEKIGLILDAESINVTPIIKKEAKVKTLKVKKETSTINNYR
jgi:23S rRNA pseudoU1915 N3-methylase RlmH